ncbi:hypothetical protein FO519_006702 [Halicephalobus sp. NKZ332]|nr:hypothetical protein FO519_006702 [Halicephalobus sp. NKZ332]
MKFRILEMNKDVVLETPPESSSESDPEENDPDVTLSLSNVTDFCSETTDSEEMDFREDEENEDIKIPEDDFQYEISDDDFDSCKELGTIKDTIKTITEHDGLYYITLVQDSRTLVISATASKGLKSEGQEIQLINDSWMEEKFEDKVYLIEPKIKFST